ncbi:aspartate dehydrogenase [Halostella sp. PRR32]|uniref:aspartate dehydrogenase n=1 Tax=Halostella sp. PRR32 TaxID=3098147 RepID=UPI00110E9363|nr:aspartate dehydrogenase [Halostella sp. PRR32]
MTFTVGLIGCGTIGQEIARAFANGTIDADLARIYDRNPEKRQAVVDSFEERDQPTAVDEITALSRDVDLVVEAAGQSAVADVTVPSLEAGCDVLLLSAGALADADLRRQILRAADEQDRIVHVPSGAIAGLDAVKAASLTGDLEAVSLTTTKNPAGLEGAPYLLENDIDVQDFETATTVFEGPATEAASAFPSNINVAMALSLAGIGPDETTVQIVADPAEENNVHQIEATGEMGSIETTVRNVPSPTNPKTSYLAAISAIEKLRGLSATLRVGT